ncbi:hypothetical protein [Roseivirga misakiensis]|uniref:Uncharacterized protein n=1 Tax=Roseivirga misakiensis TaxID=1563681 RepID=A0A1E5SK39_9BACT|nr:hypothetical protein [Roseivirga misakiensis]OEJ99487.1 hypothetical protein BFP71_07845 [Roseivirga misakiensis]
MGFFDNVVGKLFGKQNGKSAFIHEVLSRSEREISAYEAWKNTPECSTIIADIERGYYLKKQGIASSMEVHLLESQYSNGFAITFNQEFTPENFQHVFDYFKEKGLDQGYKLAQADRRILDKDTYEETIEKWYLKPNGVDDSTGIADQKYGNILIEKVAIDRKENYMKLMANIYQDRQYTEAKPFTELIELLFKPEK